MVKVEKDNMGCSVSKITILAPRKYRDSAHLVMLYQVLHDNGFNVVEFSLAKLLKPEKKIWNIHWINPHIRGTLSRFGINKSHIIISLTRMAWFILIVKASQLTKTKIIWSVHNVEMHTETSHRLETYLTRFLLRNVVRVTAYNNYIKEHLEENYSVGDVLIMRQGRYENVDLSTSVCGQEKLKYGIKEDDFVLLFFGNLMQYKGVDLVIKAMNTIEDKSIKLIIAGSSKNDPEYGMYLKELCSEIDYGNVVLIDKYVSEGDISILFNLANYAIYPYRKISNSGVLFMAIQSCTPVIISNKGGVGEVFDEYGDLGILLDDCSVRSIKNAILQAKRDNLTYSDNFAKATVGLSWKNLSSEIVSCFEF